MQIEYDPHAPTPSAPEHQGSRADFAEMFAELGETGDDQSQSANLPVLANSSAMTGRAPQPAGARLKLGERAAAITHDLFDIVARAARVGELDVNDAMKLLPPVHRVREHDDKMEQLNNGGKPLPTIIWNIGVGGAISAKVMPAAEVVDVADVDESDNESQAGAPCEHDPQLQQSGLVFELLPVQQRAGAEGEACERNC